MAMAGPDTSFLTMVFIKLNLLVEHMIDVRRLHWYVHENDNIPKIIRIPLLAISNFLFQGMFYMDRTERTVTISLTLGVGLILRWLLPVSRYKWIKSLSIAHFLNFFFNGHPWAFVIHQLTPNLRITSEEDFTRWMNRLESLGNRSPSIAAIAVYGSHVRGELDGSSDLDVRVISYPGRRARVISTLLICRERIRAALTLFPIDIYVFDGTDSLSRLRDDEQPEILVDEDDLL